MTKQAWALIAGALLLAPLAACSPPAEEAPPPIKSPEVEPADVVEEPEPKEEPAEDEGPERSPRGHIIKQVGEPGATFYFSDPDEHIVTFVVTGITVDPACTSEWAEAPERGHFIKIDMDAEMSPNALPEELFHLNVNGTWKWITPTGTVANGEPVDGNAWFCLNDHEKLPAWIGPGEKVTGSLILDVPGNEGSVVFSQGPNSGWEWAVPAE